MAYDFIPTSTNDIVKTISDKTISEELVLALMRLHKKFPSIKDPLALDPKAPRIAKVTRKLQESLNIKELQAPFKRIKLEFGEGSRGGRGTGNKGNAFEDELAKDFDKWWETGKVSSQMNEKLIKGIVSEYKIDKWKDLYVDAEGALNKPRPLMVSGDNVLITPGLVDIGAIVTDITLRKGKDKKAEAGVYLSLKYSGTVTFFNAGTKKYLTDAELKAGMVKNPGGITLLKMFGLDNATFCSVFNGKGKNFKSIDTTKKVNIRILEDLIKSGIGYGYHMVHKLGQEIISKPVTKAYRDNASNVKKVTVFYGGKTGTGKRVDIEVITPTYILKFNFRNKQGGNYISHLMCDYSYAK